MDLKILNESKDEIQIEFDNLTIPELLRAYLNRDSAVSFAAWKREHPTKNPVLVVRTSGKSAKKAIADAVKEIGKELNNFEGNLKKL